MTPENHSSKQEETRKIEELKKKADNLQKILDLTRETIEHDTSMLNKNTGHNRFGRYEMT